MSIFYAGNTYLFGATIGPITGTGTTSYVFGGLSSGTSYGFLIWAFNSGGTSSIVGPLQIFTSSISPITPESRPEITAFSWTWPNNEIPSLQYWSGSDVNMFNDSVNLGVQWWGAEGFTRTAYIERLPNGDTGWLVESPGSYAFLSVVGAKYLEGGNTYVVSWYQHTGSSAGLLFSIYGNQIGGSDTLPVQQVLPQVGTGTTSSIGMSLLGPTGGQTGWIRYAVQLYVTGNSRTFTMPYRTTDIATKRGFIIGAPQLEKNNT